MKTTLSILALTGALALAGCANEPRRITIEGDPMDITVEVETDGLYLRQIYEPYRGNDKISRGAIEEFKPANGTADIPGIGRVNFTSDYSEYEGSVWLMPQPEELGDRLVVESATKTTIYLTDGRANRLNFLSVDGEEGTQVYSRYLGDEAALDRAARPFSRIARKLYEAQRAAPARQID